MTETQMSAAIRWNIHDLDAFPDDNLRREIVDGELFVSRAPHPDHQLLLQRFFRPLDSWNEANRLGRLRYGIGIVFTIEDAVIPDLVWASHERWARILDENGRLVRAPELVIEVLSPGAANERRDREVKLKLYSAWGVDEYWVPDRETEAVFVYRRQNARLELVATLRAGDTLTSPVLPGFAIAVSELFAPEV